MLALSACTTALGLAHGHEMAKSGPLGFQALLPDKPSSPHSAASTWTRHTCQPLRRGAAEGVLPSIASGSALIPHLFQPLLLAGGCGGPEPATIAALGLGGCGGGGGGGAASG